MSQYSRDSPCARALSFHNGGSLCRLPRARCCEEIFHEKQMGYPEVFVALYVHDSGSEKPRLQSQGI